MNKKLRAKVKNKYNGLCAYSGTPLEDDWQVDHLFPKIYFKISGENGVDSIDNLMPTQKIINHYKRSLDLETFRTEWLGKLHFRLAKLPRKPRTEKSKRHVAYMRKVASYFNITETQPFSGVFYFEQLNNPK